jgi:surface polysaccharide O-acyltransferase-like enzyme
MNNSTGVGDRESAIQRAVAIDVLKASAIVTVIWIHAFVSWSPRQGGLLPALGSLSRFAVPAFFFAAGFLHFRDAPIRGNVLARRLNRVVWPYLVASLIALAAWSIQHGRPSWHEAFFWLLIGNCVGIYYFVPPFIGAVVFGTVVSRWRSLQTALFLVFFALGLAAELGLFQMKSSIPTQPFLWNLRNPLRWWGYYLAGWFAARHGGRLSEMGKGLRRRLGVVLLVMAVVLLAEAMLAFPEGRTRPWLISEYIRIYACIFGIFFLAWDYHEVRVMRWLSEATYPIYLYHFFFIAAYVELFLKRGRTPLLGTASCDEFVLALAGSVFAVVLGRRLLGRYARLIIG